MKTKTVLALAFFLAAGRLFAQSPQEADILKLSEKMFKWEVAGNVDSMSFT